MTLEPPDKVALAELNAAFAGLLDERRFPEVAELFCEDGVLNRVDGTAVRGRVNIEAAQSARHEWVDTVHHVAAPMIEPSENGEARGRVSFVAVSVDTRDGSTQGWVIGYFSDKYRRENGSWRIAERSIHAIHRR